MEVLDLDQTRTYELRYDVIADDTAADPDLLPLPDTKSHEFFAVAGRVMPSATGSSVVSSSDPEGIRVPLPSWHSEQDLTRARAVADDHPQALEILEGAGQPLLASPELSSLFFAFSENAGRVPITQAQSRRGALWDLSGAEPGTYQIVAHTFSPPYNAWTPRPGLVRLTRGGRGPAGLWLANSSTRLFASHGNRIRGCASAPQGSRLSIGIRAEHAPDSDFEDVLTNVELDAMGRFESCVSYPEADAMWATRATLETPDGDRVFGFMEGPVTTFAAGAGCEPTSTRCCPYQAQDAPQGAGADAGLDSPPVASTEIRARSGQCAARLSAGGSTEASGSAWLLGLAALGSRWRRR